MKEQSILEKLDRLEQLILDSIKEMLTVDDLINRTGYKRILYIS